MAIDSPTQRMKAQCDRCDSQESHAIFAGYRKISSRGYHVDHYLLECERCANTIWLRRSPESGVDTYYPPPKWLKPPAWLADTDFEDEDAFVSELLQEIYTALQYDLPRAAAAGVRSLIELIAVRKCGDGGSFWKNLETLREAGYLSGHVHEQLKAVVDAGSASIHRGFKPDRQDLITMVNIMTSLVRSIYVDAPAASALKERTPQRPSKPKPKRKDD
jgi:hypothetical protein